MAEPSVNDHLEVFEGVNGQFWWRRQSANGEYVSGGLEGFTREADAWRAAERAQLPIAKEVAGD